MEPDQEPKNGQNADKAVSKPQEQRPDWANGLQKLYKSVVDEPLPDSFKDLLSKLDDKS